MRGGWLGGGYMDGWAVNLCDGTGRGLKLCVIVVL